MATVGLIGAGNFTGQVLLPALKKTGAELKIIASSGGVSGTHLGKKFGFEQSTTDVEKIIRDPGINTVFITTRHNTHARLALEALRAGKHVFVEKPLCLTLEELNEFTAFYHSHHSLSTTSIKSATSTISTTHHPSSTYHAPSAQHAPSTISTTSTTQHASPLLMVGFNRRFAPQVVKMKELLEATRGPKSFIMTVNAGFIPVNHWTQDQKVGGGRVIGEACHFIDLLRFLAGEAIANSEIVSMKNGSPSGDTSPAGCGTGDTVTITLSFIDGSIGTVHYFANGTKAFPKERLEIFCGGKILQLDNFKVLRGYGWKNFKKMKLWRQDKGHVAGVSAFTEAVKKGGPSPIPFEEIAEVTRTTIELANRSK